MRISGILIGLGLLLTGCSQQGVGTLLEEYMWEKRLLLVFAPEPEHPELPHQRRLLRDAQTGLKDRDMMIWEVVHEASVRVDGASKPQLSTQPFYQHFNVPEDHFQVILIGKDGTEKLRQSTALSMEDLFARIDAMPMRQQEMREQTP